MAGSTAIRGILILFRDDPWGFPASLLLHSVFLLILSGLLSPKISPPIMESIPVEIWSPKEWDALGMPAPPESAHPETREPPAIPAQPAEAMPQNHGPIRAAKMLAAATLAHPGSRAMRVALERMEETTRLEQLCGIEAMAQIAAHLMNLKPDRIVAYAKAEVKFAGNVLVADGAAFRSGRNWHDLTFTCELGRDRQSVQAFEFTVGSAIPKRDWERYNLPSPELDTD